MLPLLFFFLNTVVQSTAFPVDGISWPEVRRGLAEVCATDTDGFLGVDSGIAVQVAVEFNFYLTSNLSAEEITDSILPLYEIHFNNEFGKRLIEACGTSDTNVTDYADIVGLETFPPDEILMHSNGSAVECINPDTEDDDECYRVLTQLTLYVNDTAAGVEAAFQSAVRDSLALFGGFVFFIDDPLNVEVQYFPLITEPAFVESEGNVIIVDGVSINLDPLPSQCSAIDGTIGMASEFVTLLLSRPTSTSRTIFQFLRSEMESYP